MVVYGWHWNAPPCAHCWHAKDCRTGGLAGNCWLACVSMPTPCSVKLFFVYPKPALLTRMFSGPASHRHSAAHKRQCNAKCCLCHSSHTHTTLTPQWPGACAPGRAAMALANALTLSCFIRSSGGPHSTLEPGNLALWQGNRRHTKAGGVGEGRGASRATAALPVHCSALCLCRT